MSTASLTKTLDQACQEIIEQWRAEHPGVPFDIDVVTQYAWNKKLIRMPRSAAIKEWRKRFSRAATKRHVTDPQGRRVHAYVPLRVDVPGQKKQKFLWDWYSTMSADHAHGAFQQQWDEIAGRCKSLNNSQGSFNDNNPNAVGNPSQLTFDFTTVVEAFGEQQVGEIVADEFTKDPKEARERRTRGDRQPR